MRWGAILLLVSCSLDSEESGARARYNEGVRALGANEWEAAATALLEARDQAGQDPELRYRAAFNLGLAHAGWSETKGEDPAGALDELRQSAGWFRDALRLRPDAEDARANLEIVLRRAQVLADRLNRGANSLEARLDRLIDDQRTLRDRVRDLLAKIDAAGASAEPIAFEPEFTSLATFERTQLAEAGTVSDLAGEELDLLQGKDEETRTDQDRVRQAQLAALDTYLQRARTGLADARRRLRRLQGDAAHRRADAALVDLKRAREQLLDPVAVLRGIAQDESVLLVQTSALEAFGRGTVRLKDEAPPARAPAWLTAEYLAGRQDHTLQRASEVRARFSAVAAARAEGTFAAEDGAADPRPQRMIDAAEEATPFLQEAVDRMGSSFTALSSEQLGEAGRAQAEALEALYSAIERFADIRTLVELTFAEHEGVIALLTPPGAGERGKTEALTTQQRATKVREANDRDRDRLRRLEGLIGDEISALDAQPTQPTENAPEDEQAEAATRQAEADRQRFQMAEAARAQALASLDQLAEVTRRRAAGAKPTPLEVAQEAREHLLDLRRLFYSIVQHLQELLRDQTETHDGTASAQVLEDDEARKQRLGPLTEAQERHRKMGQALADALAEQADAMPGETPPQAQQQAEALAEAAQETRFAHEAMRSAAEALADAVEQTAKMTVDLEPPLGYQQTAMEHLANAIRALQPPPPPNKQDEQQPQEQQRPQDRQEEQQVSQQQAERRLQAVRDRAAERERQRRQRRRIQPEPVEKDW